MRAKVIGTLLMLASMSGLASTQVLTPQGAFQLSDHEWDLLDDPLSAVRVHQRHLETVMALPHCATLKRPYGWDQRCWAPSRCEIPDTGVSIGCLGTYEPHRGLGRAIAAGVPLGTFFQMPAAPLVPPTVLPAQLTSNGQHEPDYILVPIEAALQGSDRLTVWKEAIASGQPICLRGQCWAFRTMSSDDMSRDGRDVIAACPVVAVRDVAVPVDGCMVVAVVSADQVLVRAVVGSSLVLYSAGRPDLEIRLRLTPSTTRFAEVIGKALRSPPMNLAVEHARTAGRSISLYGVANYRSSPFLEGWREILTVHIQGLSGDLPGEELTYSVVVSITAYISKQATLRSQDYRLPEPAQQDVYNAKIRAALARQLGSLVTAMEPVR